MGYWGRGAVQVCKLGNDVVWLIGLSGAGKTTIAEAAAKRYGAELLDGDTIRDFFSNDDFSRKGRERHLLGIAKMASLISKHTPVICSFITPYEDVRERILEILPQNSTMVHVATSLEVCENRDVKGLYAKARSGEISNFTGVSDPFDEPKCAHMTLDSSGAPGHTVDDMVDQLARLFEKPKGVLLPGRWQPLHVGHEWLIQQELDRGKRVVVGIRDTPVTESDPYPAHLRKRMIEHRYQNENVEAWIMPDIEAVSYGRKVGYEVREAQDIPAEVFAVSATGVRGGNRANVSERVMEFMISEGIWDGE
jgi:adenylylsulfate kinase